MTKNWVGVKIFITVLLLLTLSLIMINFIFISTFKIYVEETLAKEISLYQAIIEKGIDVKLPNYLKVSREDFVDSNFTLFELKKDKFFFVKSSYIRDIMGNKVRLLLYWDMIILMSFILFYYLTLYRIMRRNISYAGTFEAILMVFSHKLGNFLSAHKINLELIKGGNKNAIARLEESGGYLEKDLNDIKAFVGKVKVMDHSVKTFDIKTIVEKIVNELNLKNTEKLKIKLEKMEVNSVYDDIVFGIYLMLDNAKKYSSEKISIRGGSFKGKSYLIVRNDIASDVSGGLGVGLEVASKLFGKNNHKFTWKSGRHFTARVTFGKRFLGLT